MREKDLGGMHFLAGRWPFDPRLPLLLFIHGAGGSRKLWLSQVRTLSDIANTVAADLPGHGRSPGPGHDRVEGYAAKIVSFIAAAGLPRSLVCGLSMGGAIAQQVLLDGAPGLAGGILISTGARLRVMPAVFEAIERDYPAYIEMLGRLLAAPGADAAVMQAVLREAAACPPEVAKGDFTACDRFDLTARLSEIACPVQVLAAEQDLLTPLKYSRLLADRIPDARFAAIPGAGHIVPLERPETVNRLIRGFIAGIGKDPGPEPATRGGGGESGMGDQRR